MTGKTMAEELARRNFEAEYDDLQWGELTDSVKQGWVKDAQAIIDFLSAAGFGLVADAGAKALEDAAGELTWVRPESSPCGDTESCCGSSESCDAMRPSVFTASPDWLRARAAAVRGEG